MANRDTAHSIITADRDILLPAPSPMHPKLSERPVDYKPPVHKTAEHAPMVAPKPKPKPKPTMPAYVKSGGYSIQVATCFYQQCQKDFERKLKALKLRVQITPKAIESDSVELLTQTVFSELEKAQATVDKINNANAMEGNAFLVKHGQAWRVSLGVYSDLERANAVKDFVNQLLAGDTVFHVVVAKASYAIHYVKAGPWATREDALRVRAYILNEDIDLRDAFVVKN